MNKVALLFRREFSQLAWSPLGFILGTLFLFAVGLFFNLNVLAGEKLSSDVIAAYFFYLSGASMVFSLFVAMGLFAKERETGTLPFLLSSPIRDSQIVLGKFLGAFVFLGLLILITLYMPMLILVHGKVSGGHLLAGYLGTLLLSATCLSIGAFASSLARSQVLAVATGFGMGVPLVLSWLAGQEAQAPYDAILTQLALYNPHFFTFMRGQIHSQDVIYYLSLTGFFLFLATRSLEARRWR